MDSVAWPLELGDDEAAVFEAAIELIGDGELFEYDGDRHCAVEDSSSNTATAGSATRLPRCLHEDAAWDTTLSFVDECDMGTSDDVGRLDSDTSSQATTTSRSLDSAGVIQAATPGVTTARRARVRPKEELARLRKEEGELSSKMRRLRLEVLAASRGSNSHNSPSNTLASRQHSLLFWERAASRQLQNRKRSEQENRRLTNMVQTQRRLARQLLQALNRLQSASKDSAEDLSVITPGASVAPADNNAVFAVLLDDIGEIYADLDVHTTRSSSEHSLVPLGRSLDTRLLFLEHEETTAVPFELNAVQQALWKSLGGQMKRASSRFHRTFVNFAGDVFQTSASSFTFSDGNPFYLQSQTVARKFVEADRVVVISKSRIEPKRANEGISLGAIYTETNVRVLTPGCSDGDPLTTVHVHAALTRVVPDGPLAKYWGHEDDIRSSKAAWRHALAYRSELLEEFLVVDSDISS